MDPFEPTRYISNPTAGSGSPSACAEPAKGGRGGEVRAFIIVNFETGGVGLKD